MTRFHLTPLVLLLLFVLLIPEVKAQQNFDAVQIETVEVRDNVYMLIGSGGNIGLVIGEDGAFIVDDQYAPLTEKINAAIAAVTEHSIEYVINTHWHGDHTGGNENMGEAGALIVAHDNVRKRMSTDQFMVAFDRTIPASPKAALPVITFAEDVTFHLNGEEIHAFHIRNAHTDGDAIIHFKNANAFHMGDTFFANRFPFIDLGSGGSIDGIISAANRVLSLADDDSKIIPGHGPLSSPDDLKKYRDMLMRVRAKVQQLVSQEKTLDEIKAANPTEGYEEWGTGFINAERFTEFIFNDLTSN